MKPKCRHRSCNKLADFILRKRIGISFYCQEHYSKVLRNRLKLKEKKNEKP